MNIFLAAVVKRGASLLLAGAAAVALSQGLLVPVRAGTVQYVHDGAGRLVAAIYGAGKTITHTYDPAGNLKRLGPGATGSDADQDGMDDVWENQYFGSLNRNGVGDFDQDGANDLSEFLAGTAPDDAGSVLLLLRDVTTGAVSTTVRWHSVAGRVYRLQFRSSLDSGSWEDVPGDVTAVGPLAEKADALAPGTRRFYRVQLLRAE